MIALLDFGMGNIHSILKALELFYQPVVFTSDKEQIEQADALVIPGDGAFDQAMHNLRRLGLEETLNDFRAAGRPILGVCIGFQIMFRSSEEGTESGLGWFDAPVVKFDRAAGEKVPQIGWNRLRIREGSHPLMLHLADRSFMYFVHSYHAHLDGATTDLNSFETQPRSAPHPDWVVATTYYAGTEFPSVVAADNVFATQFHPEKSYKPGLEIIENFCAYVKNGGKSGENDAVYTGH